MRKVRYGVPEQFAYSAFTLFAFLTSTMGIQGLTKLISDHAGGALKEDDMKNYFGRVVAVDASMSLYQFMIAVRPDDLGQFTLTNDAGEATRCV